MIGGSHLWRRLALASTSLLTLTACLGDDEADSPGAVDAATTTAGAAPSGSTTTAAASGGSAAATTTTTIAVDPPPEPESEPDPDPGAGSTAPASTPAPAPNPAPDPESGLAPPPASGTVPASAVVPADATQHAVVSIDAGDMSFARGGGTCSVIDGVTYVFVGEGESAQAVVQYRLTDAGPTDPYITWQLSPAQAAISDPAVLVLTLDDTRTSGEFRGDAIVGQAGVQGHRRAMSGRFGCVPAPFGITGPHPLSLAGVNCDGDGMAVRFGTRGSDAVLLLIDPERRGSGGSFEGGLSWRVGGVQYTTRWLTGALSGDGLGGRFRGVATGPDGVEFPFSGSFSCARG